MNFSTSSLYSVVFVVAFVFFSDCLACRALRFTRRPAKCRICCKQGYLLPCLLYSTHDSFSIVVFDANSCNLHLFFKVVSSQRLLVVARLMIGVFPRLLRAILQPLSPPAKIVNTMNLSKNRIQLFILSGQIFLNSFSKSFFLRFSERRFSQNLLVTFRSLFAKLKDQTCWILWKSKIHVSHLCDLRHYLFYLCFSPIFLFFFVRVVFFSQRLMVEKRPSNALLKASDAKIILRRLVLFQAFCIFCMKCFHLPFVIWCSALVAVSFLVSQKRLFVMQASECFLGHFEENQT